MTRSTRAPQRRSPDASLAHLLGAGVAALPIARYATACVAIVAAATLAVRSASSPSMAVLGGTVMLASMVLLNLVGRLSGRDPVLRDSLRRPAVALAWGVVCALVWAAAWVAGRRWPRWLAYTAAAPVFLISLWFFFENFARFVPANL